MHWGKICQFSVRLIHYIPRIVSAPKIEICGNYLNFLQFPNSEVNSFRGNYLRKYGTYIESTGVKTGKFHLCAVTIEVNFFFGLTAFERRSFSLRNSYWYCKNAFNFKLCMFEWSFLISFNWFYWYWKNAFFNVKLCIALIKWSPISQKEFQ